MGDPWNTRVKGLSDRKEYTQSTIWEGMSPARSLALRVDTLTLSKPAFMSRNRVETSSLGLWRVLISCVRVRQVMVELSPRREPQWFEWRRPLDLAMADHLTVLTRSRIIEMVLRRTMLRKEAGSRRRSCWVYPGPLHCRFSKMGGGTRMLQGGRGVRG